MVVAVRPETWLAIATGALPPYEALLTGKLRVGGDFEAAKEMVRQTGFFDPLTDPTDRALYVECEGRSNLRIGGVPEQPPFQAPPQFDMIEFAAILSEA